MRIILLAIFAFVSNFCISCTEKVVEYQTVIKHDTLTIHDTLSIDDTVTTIFVLRHAEREASGTDPNLTPDGIARGEELAWILRNLAINKIYSTPFNRTRQTVQLLAENKGLEISEYPADTAYSAFAARVLTENKNKIAVVVGHSNTVPELVRIFSRGTYFVNLAESQYDNLFVLTLHAEAPKVLHLKYGKQTP